MGRPIPPSRRSPAEAGHHDLADFPADPLALHDLQIRPGAGVPVLEDLRPNEHAVTVLQR